MTVSAVPFNADANHNYIRCINPFPAEVSRALKSEPNVNADLYGPTQLAALATSKTCFVVGKWVPMSQLKYPSALINACNGASPLVAIVPVRTPPILVLVAPNASVSVVYRRPSDSGTVVMMPSIGTILGLVCINNTSILACTTTERFVLHLVHNRMEHHSTATMPNLIHNCDLAWMDIPDPSPKNIIQAWKQKVAEFIVPPQPIAIQSISSVNNGQFALVHTNHSVEQWGLSQSGNIEIKNLVQLDLGWCIFGNPSFKITHVVSMIHTELHKDSSSTDLAVIAKHRQDPDLKLYLIKDVWSNTPTITHSYALASENDVTLSSRIHWVYDAGNYNTVLQSLSGVEIFSDKSSILRSYLWPAGKRQFIASAPAGSTHSSGGSMSSSTHLTTGVSLLLIESTKGIYEFRSSCFSDVPLYVTPMVGAVSTNPLVIPFNRDLKRATSPNRSTMTLYETVTNLFRPQPNAPLPTEKDIINVLQLLLAQVFDNSDSAINYTEQFDHLASVLQTLANGRINLYPQQVCEQVWHAAAITALISENKKRNEPELFDAQSLTSGYNYIETAKQLVNTITDQSPPLPMATLLQQALNPLAQLVRVGRSDASVEVACILNVQTTTIEPLCAVAVDAAFPTLKTLAAFGTELNGTNRDALDTVVQLLQMAHCGIHSSVYRGKWCNAVMDLLPLAYGNAYTLSQLSDSEPEFLHLRASILASGLLPQFKELMLIQVNKDQALANALFKILLAVDFHDSKYMPPDPKSDQTQNYEQLFVLCTQAPARFNAFAESYIDSDVIKTMPPAAALIFLRFYLQQMDGGRAAPFIMQYLTTATTWTGIKNVRGLLTVSQLVMESNNLDTTSVLAGTENKLLFFDSLIALQFQILCDPELLDDPHLVPAYIQNALKLGFRLPISWMIDAASPASIADLSEFLQNPITTEFILPHIIQILWRKLYQRAAFLASKDPESCDLIFNELCVPLIGWQTAADALSQLSHDEVLLVENTVGGVQLEILLVQDVDATVVQHSNLVAGHIHDPTNKYVINAIMRINHSIVEARRELEQLDGRLDGIEMDGVEEHHDPDRMRMDDDVIVEDD